LCNLGIESQKILKENEGILPGERGEEKEGGKTLPPRISWGSVRKNSPNFSRETRKSLKALREGESDDKGVTEMGKKKKVPSSKRKQGRRTRSLFLRGQLRERGDYPMKSR